MRWLLQYCGVLLLRSRLIKKDLLARFCLICVNIINYFLDARKNRFTNSWNIKNGLEGIVLLVKLKSFSGFSCITRDEMSIETNFPSVVFHSLNQKILKKFSEIYMALLESVNCWLLTKSRVVCSEESAEIIQTVFYVIIMNYGSTDTFLKGNRPGCLEKFTQQCATEEGWFVAVWFLYYYIWITIQFCLFARWTKT